MALSLRRESFCLKRKYHSFQQTRGATKLLLFRGFYCKKNFFQNFVKMQKSALHKKRRISIVNYATGSVRAKNRKNFTMYCFLAKKVHFSTNVLVNIIIKYNDF